MWPLSSDECYVSVDIEADGRIPGRNSVLSLGAATLTSEGQLVDTFSVNLEQLPGASEDVPTMRWWAAHSAAWDACHTNPEAPESASQRFHDWLEQLHAAVGWPVMVGYPAAFDGASRKARRKCPPPPLWSVREGRALPTPPISEPLSCVWIMLCCFDVISCCPSSPAVVRPLPPQGGGALRERGGGASTDNVPDNDHTSSTTPLLPQQRRSAGYFAYPS